MAEELNNPLFDDEREFLERKKQEYERALRGDVDHLKDQGVQAGKVALVGAGLAGSVWLISKLVGGKSKRKKKSRSKQADSYDEAAQRPQYGRDSYYDAGAEEDYDLDDDAFASDRSAEPHDDASHYDAGYQPRYSARQSAEAFMAQGNDQEDDFEDDFDALYPQDAEGEADSEEEFDNGFGSRSHHADRPARTTHADLPSGRLDFGPTVHQHRQGQSYESPVHTDALAYDDSRRLPKSAEFAEASYEPAGADVPWPKAAKSEASLGKRAGGMLKSFLETNTGKAVAAQVAAVVLAYVSKKMNDHQPADTTSKNADLANAPATTSFYAPLATPPQSSPAVSLTYTDAPTEHPAS